MKLVSKDLSSIWDLLVEHFIDIESVWGQEKGWGWKCKLEVIGKDGS